MIPSTIFFGFVGLVTFCRSSFQQEADLRGSCNVNIMYFPVLNQDYYYRAMHFSAKRGIAIACRPSVRPSVRLSVCLSECNVQVP